MSYLRTLWRTLRLGEHLVTGILLTAVFHREARDGQTGRHRPALVRWWHRRLCRILAIDVRVRGLPADAALLTANHVSWLDIPVLGAVCATVFVSKAEVRRWPLVGWLAGTAGTLFISRGGNQSRQVTRDIADVLNNGRRLVLFPEGTTTDGSGVRPFHPRLLAAAVDSDLPIQPVALRYFRGRELDPVAPFIGDEPFSHHLWRILRQGRTRVEVVFCTPLQPPFTDRSRRQLAYAARHAIVDALPGQPNSEAAPDQVAAGPMVPVEA